jgi:hypothetical protein
MLEDLKQDRYTAQAGEGGIRRNDAVVGYGHRTSSKYGDDGNVEVGHSCCYEVDQDFQNVHRQELWPASGTAACTASCIATAAGVSSPSFSNGGDILYCAVFWHGRGH